LEEAKTCSRTPFARKERGEYLGATFVIEADPVVSHIQHHRSTIAPERNCCAPLFRGPIGRVNCILDEIENQRVQRAGVVLKLGHQRIAKMI
jgi:hypothetical protein